MKKRLSVQNLTVAFEIEKRRPGLSMVFPLIWRKAKLWALSANPVPVSLSQLFQSWVCSRKMGELPAAGFLWMAKRLQTWEKKNGLEFKAERFPMVFQEPMTSLNPVLKIGRQVGEVLKRHRNMDRDEIRQAVLQSLKKSWT